MSILDVFTGKMSFYEALDLIVALVNDRSSRFCSSYWKVRRSDNSEYMLMKIHNMILMTSGANERSIQKGLVDFDKFQSREQPKKLSPEMRKKLRDSVRVIPPQDA